MYKKYLFSLLFIVFIACQKDNTPSLEEPKKDCRLTKIIQGINNGAANDTTFTFYYDNAGKLSKITQSSFDDTWDYMLNYDNQNRLVKVEGPTEWEYAYNNKGLLSEIRYSKFSFQEKLVFEYGADSVPVLARNYELSNGQWMEQTKYQYTYQNGNIVMVEMFWNGASQRKHYFEYYENIPNNFKTLSLIDMFYIGLGSYEDFLSFNKNMLKKGNRQDDGYFIDYKIDSGNIFKSVSTWLTPPNNDSSMRETRFFFYDCK